MQMSFFWARPLMPANVSGLGACPVGSAPSYTPHIQSVLPPLDAVDPNAVRNDRSLCQADTKQTSRSGRRSQPTQQCDKPSLASRTNSGNALSSGDDRAGRPLWSFSSSDRYWFPHRVTTQWRFCQGQQSRHWPVRCGASR